MEAKFKSIQRSTLAKEISNITESESKYLGAPSMAYQIGDFTVKRDGTVECNDEPEMKALIAALALKGVEYEPTEKNSISLPMISPEALANLKAIIEAKAELLKQALGTDNLTVLEEGDKITFPWFRELGPDEANAYMLLLTRMVEVAKIKKRVTAKPREIENAKYSFRCFLLGLGFIGDEYKGARKVLLKNLNGSAAFKSGSKKEVAE